MFKPNHLGKNTSKDVLKLLSFKFSSILFDLNLNERASIDFFRPLPTYLVTITRFLELFVSYDFPNGTLN